MPPGSVPTCSNCSGLVQLLPPQHKKSLHTYRPIQSHGNCTYRPAGITGAFEVILSMAFIKRWMSHHVHLDHFSPTGIVILIGAVLWTETSFIRLFLLTYFLNLFASSTLLSFWFYFVRTCKVGKQKCVSAYSGSEAEKSCLLLSVLGKTTPVGVLVAFRKSKESPETCGSYVRPWVSRSHGCVPNRVFNPGSYWAQTASGIKDCVVVRVKNVAK